MLSFMDDIKTQWDLTYLYKTINDPKIAKDIEKEQKIVLDFVKKWQDEDSYLEDNKALLKALKDYEKVLDLDSPYYYFSFLNFELNNNDENLQAQYNKTSDILTKLNNQIEFFENKLGKTSIKRQSEILQDKELSRYQRFLQRIFEKSQFILSEKEEKIINLLSKPASKNWNKFLSKQISKVSVLSLNEKGKKEKHNFSQLLSLLASPQKKVRDESAKNIYKILNELSDFSTEELNSYLETKKIIRDIRGYKRYDQDRHLSDDIPTNVVDNLVEVVWNNLDIVHEYYKLKSKLLGLRKIKYYERNVPFIPENQKENLIKFDVGASIVEKSLNSIDPIFSIMFKDMLKNAVIDVYPKNGKSRGAYCMHGSKNIPPYILLNYTDKNNDVMTLAHEVGHAIHHKYYNTNQPSMYTGSSLAVAEVASTISEEFTFEYLLKELDDLQAFALRVNKLQDTMNTIFRQIAFYKMETEFYKKFDENSYIKKSELQSIFKKISKQELGEYVDFIEGAENTWINVNHFRYGFYVYSYASGEIIAKSIKKLIQKNNSAQILIDIMKAGKSKSTIDIFKDAGIDITKKEFFESGINDIRKELESLKIKAKELMLI